MAGATIDKLITLLQAHCPDVAMQTLVADRVNTLRQALGDDGEQVLARTVEAAGSESLVDFILSQESEELAERLQQAQNPEDPCIARWQRLDLLPIPGLDTFADILSVPVQVVVAVLQFVKGILQVISALLLTIPDPLKALILAAYTILKQIIDNFLATGAYIYFDAPGITSNVATLSEMGMPKPELPQWIAGDKPPALPKPGDGFDTWAHRFSQSFDDPGDENRPIFSEGALIEAVFVVATAPNLVNLRPILKLLAKLLDLTAFDDAFEKYRKSDDEDRTRVAQTPVAPDWRSWKLRDVGPPEYPLRELEKIPEWIRGLLQNIDDIVTLIQDLIKAISDKIDLLLKIAKIIQDVIDMIRALSSAGLYRVQIITDKGVDGLKKGFLEAKNRPNESAPAGQGIVGVCFLGGVGEFMAPHLALLWTLLGVDGTQCIDSLENPALFAKAEKLGEQAVKSYEDAAAMADDAWKGSDRYNDSASDKGVEGLWGEFKDDMNEQKETLLNSIGKDEKEANELMRSGRNQLISDLEQVLAEGATMDPFVLSHIEATRRARKRGRRSLAMGFGNRISDS